MKKPEQAKTHKYEINGELVDLVLDMRAKDLATKYAIEYKIKETDMVLLIVASFVAMANSAAIRIGSDERISVDDIMESDFDLKLLTEIVRDVKDAAYKMEWRPESAENDLYADEVADNETPQEGVS